MPKKAVARSSPPTMPPCSPSSIRTEFEFGWEVGMGAQHKDRSGASRFSLFRDFPFRRCDCVQVHYTASIFALAFCGINNLPSSVGLTRFWGLPRYKRRPTPCKELSYCLLHSTPIIVAIRLSRFSNSLYRYAAYPFFIYEYTRARL